MKKSFSILLIGILSLNSFNCFSQYDKLINKNKKWVIKQDYWLSPGYNNGSYTDYYYGFFTDSTFTYNSKTYNIFFHQTFHISYHQTSGPNYNDTLGSPEKFLYLREDTISKIVTSLRSDLNNPGQYYEDTIYNFNLSVGDTFVVKFPFKDLYVVDSIKMTTLHDNTSRKTFYFRIITNSCCSPVWYTEGIGGSGHWTPFSTYVGFGVQTTEEMICYYKNDSLLYFDCIHPNYIVKGINENSINELYSQVNVYPNPSSSSLFYINIPRELKGINLDIIDAKGIRVQQTTLENENNNLNLNLPNGVYFLRFYQNHNSFYQKLIINK